ncbi:MAG: hypothetical protein IJ017_08500 [Oscillospiraceae bacterium]|nr:hypothetical protein [Oscillospiraceae bacterium]
MKKLLRAIAVVVVAVIVVVGAVLIVKNLNRPEPSDYSLRAASAAIAPISADAADEELTAYAREILAAIGSRDYTALSSIVHEDFGVVFSPYSTVSLTTGLCFTASQIAEFGSDSEKYIWGVYDVGGEPIEMTPGEYFDEFVFDTDFTKCENFGVDEILRSGNALENITEMFPEARFVDCYMPGTDGSDWKSLRLVFEEKDGQLWLTAIVHSEYTI